MFTICVSSSVKSLFCVFCPFFSFGWLSLHIHGGSLCIKDANYIGDLMLCNIAGNSKSFSGCHGHLKTLGLQSPLLRSFT